MVKFRILYIYCLAFVLCGCAAHHMALTKSQSDIDLKKKSIALLSVKTSNEYGPSDQFDLVGAIICPESETCSDPMPIELKDKSVVGYSTGTFDIVVEDKFDEDIQSFIKEYPIVQKVIVKKDILPQWTRSESQSAN